MNAAATDAGREATALSLDALRRMSFEELEELYRAGRRPASVSDLDGEGEGAMLAVRRVGEPFASLLRAFGKSSLFPWRGKTFRSRGADRGEGINRVDLGFTRARWFPFATRFDASFLDGRPAFVLDYSGPGNPPLIRQIVDELREVAPGLYLGPAALKVGGRPRPVLFFAVSLR